MDKNELVPGTERHVLREPAHGRNVPASTWTGCIACPPPYAADVEANRYDGGAIVVGAPRRRSASRRRSDLPIGRPTGPAAVTVSSTSFLSPRPSPM